MPMYEGIGLISEKHAVVVDIGSAYTKCGYAGEFSPRCIIPSKTADDRGLHDITAPDELYNALVEFMHKLYFKVLLVNPKDRRVVVVDSVLGSTLFKDTLAKVLFRHYEVSSVLFAPSHLLPLFTLGIKTALVLDVGYREATVIPVFEGVLILKAWQAQPLAGAAVQESLKADLILRGVISSGSNAADIKPLGESPQLLTKQIIEDLMVRCCAVTSISRGKDVVHVQQDASSFVGLSSFLANCAPSVRYPIGGDKLLQVDSIAREAATELLWQMDQDGISIASLVLDAILACPLDCRRQLANSLVLVGGMTMMPGFKSRLREELAHLLTLPKYQTIKIDTFKMFRPPTHPSITTWLGGAIFGATDVVLTRSLSREQYLKDPGVPDWSSLRFNSAFTDIQQRQG